MPVETEADRAVFVNSDEFGATVTWTPAAGGATMLNAVFDNGFQLLTGPLLEEGMEASSPRILCRSADLPAGAAHDDTVTIGSESYRVVEIMPDGTGMTDVRLHEV